MDKTSQPPLLESQLAQLYTQAAMQRIQSLESKLYLAEQRAMGLEQRLYQLQEAYPIAGLPDLFDEEAYRVLNAEQLQHSSLSVQAHFEQAAPMSVRWMQGGKKSIPPLSDQHVLVVCALYPTDLAEQQKLYELLLDLQYRYEITVLQLGTAVLDWSEFNRVYVHNVRHHYGELQYTIQYLKQRYPSLQHSLIFGVGAKNAYWSLALAGLPRTAVFWQDSDALNSQSTLQELFFWANAGVAQPSAQPYLSALFSDRGLAAWQFADWQQLTRTDWIHLLEQSQAQHLQHQTDSAHIRAAQLFVSSFFAPDFNEEVDQSQYLEQYLRRWHTGIEPRKPCPGFNPAIYAERNQLPPFCEPLGHYVAQGKPTGPWQQRTIKNASVVVAADAPVALHIHAYYVDMLPELLQRLESNQSRPDLFISVRDQADADIAAHLLADYTAKVDVRIVPNRGRDIGPLLTEFGPELVQNYRYIGHIHTKQSLHVQERDAVTAWQRFLLEAMLGSTQSGAMLDACISQMVLYPDCSMVYPDDPKMIGWDANQPFAQLLADKMQLGTLPNAFNFPVGTMFWMRDHVLARFVGLGLGWQDYPPEPIGKDGTILHALERLFGVVPLVCNQPYSVAWAIGFSR